MDFANKRVVAKFYKLRPSSLRDTLTATPPPAHPHRHVNILNTIVMGTEVG